MARASNIEFKVGVVIIILIALLAGSLYWLQGYKLESNARQLMVKFDDVGTLAVGDRVTVSGVRKGKVDGLQLTEDGVLVKLLIYPGVVLHQDAAIRIRNMGVMGERYIAIDPGDAEEGINWDEVQEGQYDTGLPEVMGELGSIVTELRHLVVTVRSTLLSDTTMSNFSQIIINLQRTTESVSDFLVENRERLDTTTSNFVSASKQLKLLVENNAEPIDSTISRMNRMTGDLEVFVNQLDTLAQASRRLATAINSNDGTLQLLLEDDRLYNDLRMAADNLDDLVSDIRENPRKYIDFKVEIF